jgi:serine/threonine protein kinase
MVKKLFHLETKNGRGHYQILGPNNKSKNLVLRPVTLLHPKPGIIKVDAGQQGAIFLATFNSNGSNQFVIKVCPYNKKLTVKNQISAVEYNIETKLYKVVPGRVPKPLGFFYCKNFVANTTWGEKKSYYDYSRQTITCMEYIENGTFSNYLSRMAASPRKRLNDSIMRSFINQVLRTLLKIMTKYPQFRHGDLHLDNLLVRPARPIPKLVLTDFGWSRLRAKGTNPVVDSGKWKGSHGIGPNMSNMYDAHLFLSQLRNWIIRHTASSADGFIKTIAFLDRYVPEGYREDTDLFTRNFRLKYGIKYPFTLRTILNSQFLKTGKGPVKMLSSKQQILEPAKSLLVAYGAGPTPSMPSPSVKLRKSPQYK